MSQDQNEELDQTQVPADIAIETRLIGAEDVYWDDNGIDEIDSFTDRTGTERRITGINSGKIPLQNTVREQLPGTSNITEALLRLAELAGSSKYSILDEDTVVELGAGLTHEEKQALINAQIRNLGGHVLTFQFPESLDIASSFSFDFSGFHNGKLVVDLNGIELSDAVILSCLILVQDCSCHVEITNGTLKHTVTSYAIKAIRCPHIYLTEMQFSGSGAADSYALYAEDSDGYAEDCVFSQDNQVLTAGYLSTAPVSAHNTSANPHPGVLAPLESPAFTGTPTAPTATAGTNTTQIATTAFVQEAVSNHDSSPAFTGTPTAPTAAAGTNTTQIATTAFVQDAVGSAFELDWDNAFALPAANVVYQAERAGILQADGTTGAQASATISLFLYPEIPAPHSNIVGPGITLDPSREGNVYMIIPKGGYYEAVTSGTFYSFVCFFVPFKNSIANS